MLSVRRIVSGLWHGAAWNYVFWGGLHGVYQIAGSLTMPWRKKCLERMNVKTECRSFLLGRQMLTFILVVIAWVFFRADSLGMAVGYLKRIFMTPDPWALVTAALSLNGDCSNAPEHLKTALKWLGIPRECWESGGAFVIDESGAFVFDSDGAETFSWRCALKQDDLILSGVRGEDASGCSVHIKMEKKEQIKVDNGCNLVIYGHAQGRLLRSVGFDAQNEWQLVE